MAKIFSQCLKVSPMKRLPGVKHRPLALALTALLACLSTQAASAATYYVSKGGNNGDALSLNTAWSDLNKINWTAIKKGDIIFIQEGSYSSPLDIHFNENNSMGLPTGSTGVTLANLNPGKKVLISGSALSPYGINFNNSNNVALAGQKQADVLVSACKGAGIAYGANSGSNTLVQVESQASPVGVKLDGKYQFLFNCIINDNGQNVQAVNNKSGGYFWLQKVWIFNSTVDKSTGAAGSDGIRCIQSNSANTLPTLVLQQCVLGPNLRYGTLFVGNGGTVTGVRSLFLNAGVENLNQTWQSNGSVLLDNCTSYLTNLNANNAAHGILQMNSGTLTLNNSVFYGGSVSLAPAVKIVNQSTSTVFKVTGGPLPANVADPHFASLPASVTVNAPSLDAYMAASFSSPINPGNIGQIASVLSNRP